MANGKDGHNVLGYMVERGELAAYLAATIFTETNDELAAGEGETVEA